jgi:protein transport protein SEC61 subunit alpha
VLSLLIGVCEALALVVSGSYGNLDTLGKGNALLIVIQLTMAVYVVIMLDEMLQSGYGLGSGISLFIATNVCETIIWKSFSPITIRTSGQTEFEGAVIAVIHKLFTARDLKRGLYHVMFRSNAPNFNQLLGTIFIFLVVIYFQVPSQK